MERLSNSNDQFSAPLIQADVRECREMTSRPGSTEPYFVESNPEMDGQFPSNSIVNEADLNRDSPVDVEWLRSIVSQWEGPLVRYAFRLTGDLELGRDVVQETFLRLCREERTTVEPHLARWLFAVCRSRALDVRRKESRMSVVIDLDERSSLAEVPPHQLLETQEATGRLINLLESLPDNQREVIRLKFQNDLSYREISEITGLTVSNVGFLLHTGIRKLRDLMTDGDGAAR